MNVSKFYLILSDCKYTCHAHCRDLVHLGCRRNGKLMDCLAPHDTLDPSYNNGQRPFLRMSMISGPNPSWSHAAWKLDSTPRR
ncbi:ras association domain-containing protein 3 [Limosa lapponica baueri]|uniref:Ras association domain-containing protein 3 n=1 Tax=Limosa lapponica baueri TaxID=1758121 RepID=A0A2I0UR57_LIMLA|nr:ras association domain-containing protein 3 [Limosa lapponica baueri]